MHDAFFATSEELAALPPSRWPEELISHRHLIYSSPAALAFNSPGAEGFGVKRAALTIPNSAMLLFSPACCGRNTGAIGGSESKYASRMYYLLLDDTDIVTGRYLKSIVESCCTIMERAPQKPSVLVLCSTCVDALLGTDMERVTRMASKECGIPVVSATMYALTREGALPPMVLVRRTIYSLLKKRERKSNCLNFLGYFTHIEDSSEIYPLLRDAGIERIQEIGRMQTMEEYERLSEANCNLVFSRESRMAVRFFEETLSIPSIELFRSYQKEKIANQYMLLSNLLGVSLSIEKYQEKAEEKCLSFREIRDHVFAIGETANADPFDLALALLRLGGRVSEIFAEAGSQNVSQIRAIAALSPQTRIYSNLSPTMLLYDPRRADPKVTCAIGYDACFYHPECAGIPWVDEAQPFGFEGLSHLIDAIQKAGGEHGPSL